MGSDRIEHVVWAAAEITEQERPTGRVHHHIVIRFKAVPATMMMAPEVDLYAPDGDDARLRRTSSRGPSDRAPFHF